MKRDDIRNILGENATEEQITNLLNSFHNAEKSKNDEITTLKSELTKFSDYDDLKSKLTSIEQANMTEQQKLESQKKEIEKNLRESRIIVNTAKAKEILAGEKVDEKLIASLVDDNLETTIAKANMFKQTLTELKDSIAKQTRESMANVDLKPSISNVNPNEDVMNFEKFSKLSAEEQEKFITEHPEEFKNL